MCRRCGEQDKRGSSKVRRARRQRLLEGAGHSSHGGNGFVTACWWCGRLVGQRRGYMPLPNGGRMLIERMEQDRISRRGWYSLYNLVAACHGCNWERFLDELRMRAVEIPDGCEHGPVTT